jgi:hypothetical protein
VSEAIWLGLLLVVLFVAFVPLKWGCATCSCISAVLSFIGLFLAAGVMMFLAPGSGVEGFFGWVLGLANAGVYLWLASVLYRDLQNLGA